MPRRGKAAINTMTTDNWRAKNNATVDDPRLRSLTDKEKMTANVERRYDELMSIIKRHFTQRRVAEKPGDRQNTTPVFQTRYAQHALFKSYQPAKDGDNEKKWIEL